MKLTENQIEEIQQDVSELDDIETKPCRFLVEGRALDICTGVKCSRNSNVFYHPVYWNFSKDVANKISGWLNAKVVWSK